MVDSYQAGVRLQNDSKKKLHCSVSYAVQLKKVKSSKETNYLISLPNSALKSRICVWTLVNGSKVFLYVSAYML